MIRYTTLCYHFGLYIIRSKYLKLVDEKESKLPKGDNSFIQYFVFQAANDPTLMKRRLWRYLGPVTLLSILINTSKFFEAYVDTNDKDEYVISRFMESLLSRKTNERLRDFHCRNLGFEAQSHLLGHYQLDAAHFHEFPSPANYHIFQFQSLQGHQRAIQTVV